MFMRRLCMYGIITIVLVVSYRFHTLAQDGFGPRLVLEEEMYDFGKVREGEVLKHTFRVFNKGDKPLLIGRVKPG